MLYKNAEIKEVIVDYLIDKHDGTDKLPSLFTQVACIMKNGFGVLCGMLALIGLANVFSNTLGSLYQRRREFARYISVGLTPRGLKKIFFFEGLMVGLQPVLFSLPVTLVLLALFLAAGHLPLSAYLSRLPIIPLAAFVSLLWAFIALAYILGYRTLVLDRDIIKALKDDTTL